MTEGDEAGDVGVARVLCGLAEFNQHLDHVFVEATEGFDNQGKKHATLFLHLRVVLDDLAVGAVERSVTRDRGGLGVSIRRGSRVRNRPVSSEYLCHVRERVVAVKSFSIGQDALVDGGEAELVGDLLQGFVEAVVAFDNGGLVGLLARHEVVDRVVRQEEAACTACFGQLAEFR